MRDPPVKISGPCGARDTLGRVDVDSCRARGGVLAPTCLTWRFSGRVAYLTSVSGQPSSASAFQIRARAPPDRKQNGFEHRFFRFVYSPAPLPDAEAPERQSQAPANRRRSRALLPDRRRCSRGGRARRVGRRPRRRRRFRRYH